MCFAPGTPLHERRAHLETAQRRLYRADRIRNGKPVSVPEGIWRDQPFSDRLIRLKREADTVQSIPIRNGADCLNVFNCPGHQGELVENNVVIVMTSDGLTFAHTGDQSNRRDLEWLDSIAQKHRIDVLMPNCGSPDLPRMIAGFRPALIIPGHESELSRTATAESNSSTGRFQADHRRPDWLNRVRLGEDTARVVSLTWGESYEYVRVDGLTDYRDSIRSTTRDTSHLPQ